MDQMSKIKVNELTLSSVQLSQDKESVVDLSVNIIQEMRQKIKIDVKARTEVHNKLSEFNQEQ